MKTIVKQNYQLKDKYSKVKFEFIGDFNGRESLVGSFAI